MIDLIPMFYGIPVAEIERDIKDGKFILKSQGNINSNINAQTVIVYGNVNGPIKADQVVIINGDAIGIVHADNVTKLESKEKKKSKEKKNCTSCFFYKKYNISYDGSWVCPASFPYHRKIDLKICEKYQEKEMQQSSIKNISRVPVKLQRY